MTKLVYSSRRVSSAFRKTLRRVFSRPESIEEDIGAEFSGCDELCNEVRKTTGCVSDTEDGEITFEEYVLYEADLPVTGMLSDADIVEMAVNDADDHADEEEPREVPTTQTHNVLRLLRNKVECSGGDQRLMRCVEQLENAFLEREHETAHQKPLGSRHQQRLRITSMVETLQLAFEATRYLVVARPGQRRF
ncbi:hypothetical protein HPB52_021234 [Rhipicephalus sanguineus]|uniref:Uncharacterized protein n=1 Tax=Rhipicephalus sanguineus TaxID=34632 RepID=A0A9D4Q355_RHISA|nr:hypothetical protein HPB52_021234 [Rhipicephalus sanguineus]